MKRHRLFALAIFSILLAGCQTPNPYKYEIDALPPAPRKSFHSYKTWNWKFQPTTTSIATSAQLEQALSSALASHNVTKATNTPSDLQAAVYIDKERNYYPDTGEIYGVDHTNISNINAVNTNNNLNNDKRYRSYNNNYKGITSISKIESEDELIVRVVLFDSNSGQAIWAGNTDTLDIEELRKSSANQEQLTQAVNRALIDFPPRGKY